MGFGKVQARGQVTIPEEVRRAANIKAGDTLLFETQGEGRVEAVVVPTHSSLDDLFDRFSMPGKFEAERVWAEVDRDIAEDLVGPDADLAHAEATATATAEGANHRLRRKVSSRPAKKMASRPAQA